MSTTTTTLDLPSNSPSSIAIINLMGVKRFSQLSERILHQMPIVATTNAPCGFSIDERQKLIAAFSDNTPTQIDQMVSDFDIWDKIFGTLFLRKFFVRPSRENTYDPPGNCT
jgi:hypothetical protein